MRFTQIFGNMENVMVFANLEVRHKKFGVGTVMKAEGKYITVHFDGADKVFVYPDAFEKFLTLADGTICPEILADIQTEKNRRMQIENAKAQENLRSMQLGIVIPGKEFVPDEKGEDGYQPETEEP